eukprot:IDg2164t1
MDLVVLGGMEIIVAWQSGVSPEAESGLGQCPWDFNLTLSAMWLDADTDLGGDALKGQALGAERDKSSAQPCTQAQFSPCAQCRNACDPVVSAVPMMGVFNNRSGHGSSARK